MNSKTARILDDHLDKCFVYSVLLEQSHSYYGKIKTLLKVPIILTSSVMSIVNSNIGGENDEALKIVNIVFNVLTAVILGLASTFKIEEKYSNFLQAERKFLKLSSKIEQKMLNEDDIIDKGFVKEIINEYDMIVEGIDHDLPIFIKKRVRAQYATKKTLPMICNGIRKSDENRSPRLKNLKTASLDADTIKNLDVSKIPPMNSIVFSDKKPMLNPRVIETKPFVIDIPKDIEGLQL